MVITCAWGPETLTHTTDSSLILNYSIHMEVIVSHEYEMFGSLSFNTVRALLMLLVENKALKVCPISIWGNWGKLETSHCLQ